MPSPGHPEGAISAQSMLHMAFVDWTVSHPTLGYQRGFYTIIRLVTGHVEQHYTLFVELGA